jgi:hypothetical protein
MSKQLSLLPDEESEQPAQDCASSNADSDDSESKQFAELQVEAKKHAKEVASTDRLHHQAAWDALLPILDKMQKLLSQRGANHKDAAKGLPEWGFWWHDFSQKNHLGISFRTVQYRLNRYQGTSSARKQHRLGLTRREQIDLANTAAKGHSLASICKTGMGSVAEAASFYACSLPLENIEEIRERLHAGPGRPLRRDRAGRARSITLTAGPRIHENIAGLDAAEAADILQAALSNIIERFCSDIGLCVHVECLAPEREVEAAPAGVSLDREVA